MHVIFFQYQSFFQKTTVFIKFVFNDNPLLSILNNNPSLTIVNIIINNFFFQKGSSLKKNLYKKGCKSVLKQCSFSKMIIIWLIIIQNEWVVFKNDRFFPKTKQSFLKTIEKQKKDCLTIVLKMINNPNCAWLTTCQGFYFWGFSFSCF